LQPGTVQLESLVTKLLEEADKANIKQLSRKRRELDTGCYLAELCDLYFGAHPRDTQEWPCPRWAETDRILRELLGSHSPSVQQIEAGARRLGLNVSFGGPVA